MPLKNKNKKKQQPKNKKTKNEADHRPANLQRLWAFINRDKW